MGEWPPLCNYRKALPATKTPTAINYKIKLKKYKDNTLQLQLKSFMLYIWWICELRVNMS